MDTTGEKNSFCSFCVRRNYTSCSLVSQNFGYSFFIHNLSEMVAQSSDNFPIFRAHARQCGRGFDARVHKLLGELQFPLFEKKINPSCKNNWSRFI